MLRKYAEDSTHPARAQQAYLILIAAAARRETLRYGQLAEMMHFGVHDGVGRGSVLNKGLGCIIHWCSKNGLPRLTTLVVEKATGVPSGGIDPFVKPEDVPAMQEKVFDEDWYSLLPPSVEELAACRRELDEAENATVR